MSKQWQSGSTRRRWLAGALVLAVAIGLGLLYWHVDVAAWHARAERWNGPAVFAALTLLPLVGFPVSVLHVIVGVRFGTGLGLALVTVSIALQLLASYGLVRLWRRPFDRWLAPLRRRLPAAAQRPLTLFVLLLPGLPYSVQNYLLPLMGVPLRLYLGWGLPLHIARSSWAITLGDQSDRLTPPRLALLAIYGLVLATAWWWAYRRLRGQLAGPPPLAGDPTPAT